MAINRKFFFETSSRNLFDGRMTKIQAVGIAKCLDRWESEFSKADDRWLAYMLGTAHHETGRTMQPVRETFASSDAQAISRLNRAYALKQLTWVKTPYWVPDQEGKSWFGRGLVQITHRANYNKLGQLIGVDLLADPSKALDPNIAIEIMFKGMMAGAFTGVALGTNFNSNKENWRGARSIINGNERAELVATYARAYYGCISYTTG